MKTHRRNSRPRRGDRYAKIVTDRRGVTTVRSRTVLKVTGDVIIYTMRNPRRKCRSSRTEWCKWAKDARLAKR